MSCLEWIFLLLCLINYSSLLKTYDFQCLTCDNFIDGPGCGEFTRQIPVRTCRTFCYFAIIHNHSTILQSELSLNRLTRAIRDCSPYDDISIDGSLLLQSKLGSISSSSIEILTIKRCNSEQCNNEFYLKSDELLSSKTSSPKRMSFPLLFFLFCDQFFCIQRKSLAELIGMIELTFRV